MKVLFLAFLIGLTGAWVVKDAERTVDVTTQVIRVASVLTFENDGAESDSLLITLTKEESEAVAFLNVNEAGKKGKMRNTKTNDGNADFQTYKVDLPKKVAKGDSIKLRVSYEVVKSLTPFPAKIGQLDSQFVQYHGNAYQPSAYTVQKEKTVIKHGSGTSLSATTVAPSKQETDSVVYGPYSNKPAFSKAAITVHYENNSPFIVATYVERVIEISHWGNNIAVEEYIELEHKGAGLKGTFSRLDFQHDRRGRKQPALQRFTTVLPASAKDIYYRDEIGNISTSTVRLRADSVEVDIRPRYPLFGGWRTSYVIGYNVPAYEYLYNKGNTYALKMRVFDHILDNIVVEKLNTKIILPELASKIKIHTPFAMDRRPDEHRATYLDTTQRTVVVVEKMNVVNEHIQSFTLSYDYDSFNMLREPIMATVFFFCLFLVVLVYVRLDFVIVKDSSQEARDKIGSFIPVLETIIDKKQQLYSDFVNDVSEYKATREQSIIDSAKEKLSKNRTGLHNSLESTLTDIKNLSASSHEKANELLRYDQVAMDALDAYISALQKSQQKSGVDDSSLMNKVNEARNRADNILAKL